MSYEFKIDPKTLEATLAGPTAEKVAADVAALIASDHDGKVRAALLGLGWAPPWQPIDTAPRDGSLIEVYAPGRSGLPPLVSLCVYHPDAGFCVDELRWPTHWRPFVFPMAA